MRLLLPTPEELLMKYRYWEGFEILMYLFSDDVGSELKMWVHLCLGWGYDERNLHLGSILSFLISVGVMLKLGLL